MEKQKLLSEDLVTTSRSANTVRNSIPVDLLIDIFSRVPAKSIARFRCVSKSWESMFCSSDFTNLFLTNAPSRPRLLLFAFKVNEEVFFFTSPQPQNPHDNLSLVATRYHQCFPNCFPSQICPPPCGLELFKGWNGRMMVVCNPITRESITLPKVKGKVGGTSYFGYDPINKQFKVLYVPFYDRKSYQILTLGTGKPYWRKMKSECNLHFGEYGNEVCINGFLYTPTRIDDGSYVIVCFDIRLEKFSIVKMDDEMLEMNRFWRLFNYKGKLVVHKENYHGDQVMLWVREDAEKHKWSKCICIPLPSWEMGLFYTYDIVGMVDTGEIVFSPIDLRNPFYVVYYNVETSTFTRVNIEGFEEFKQKGRISLNTYLDYVENLKFLYKCVKGFHSLGL